MHDCLCISLFNQTYNIFISMYALATRKLERNLVLNYRNHITVLIHTFFCFYLFAIALILYFNHHILYMLLLRIHSQTIPETPMSHLTHSTPSLFLSSLYLVFPWTNVTPCFSLNTKHAFTPRPLPLLCSTCKSLFSI